MFRSNDEYNADLMGCQKWRTLVVLGEKLGFDGLYLCQFGNIGIPCWIVELVWKYLDLMVNICISLKISGSNGEYNGDLKRGKNWIWCWILILVGEILGF